MLTKSPFVGIHVDFQILKSFLNKLKFSHSLSFWPDISNNVLEWNIKGLHLNMRQYVNTSIRQYVNDVLDFEFIENVSQKLCIFFFQLYILTGKRELEVSIFQIS